MFGEGSGEEILVDDVWLDILFGAEFSGFGLGDKPFFELSSEDTFWQTKIVLVDIGHEGDELRECCDRRGRRRDEGLACISPVYMCLGCGVLIFKLPYRFRGMDILFVHPFVI